MMKVILYKVREKPIEIECKEIGDLLIGKIEKKKILFDWYVAYIKESNEKKDRSRYHRNTYIPKVEDGRIKFDIISIYDDFILCKMDDNNKLNDIDDKYKNEIMAMFGF
jgi:hypothetical protein